MTEESITSSYVRRERPDVIVNMVDATLSKALGCPVVETVSTTHRGLAQAVEAAVARYGQGQTAPYTQGNVDLTSKAAVEGAGKGR